MTYTEHYRLRKPADEEFIDIEDLNQNMEQLDGVLAGKASIQIGGTEPTGPGLVLWFAERKVKPQKVPPLRLSADAEGEVVRVTMGEVTYGVQNAKVGGEPDENDQYVFNVKE